MGCNDGSVGAVLDDGSFVCKLGALSSDELELARLNFLKFDVDCDGVITRTDFGRAMRVYDSSWAKEDAEPVLDSLFAAVDMEGSGAVSPAQFCVMRVSKKAAAAKRRQTGHGSSPLVPRGSPLSGGGSPRRRIPGRMLSPTLSPVIVRPPTLRADSGSESSWPSPWFVRASPRGPNDPSSEPVVATRCRVRSGGHVELTVLATRSSCFPCTSKAAEAPASAEMRGCSRRPPARGLFCQQ